MHLRDLQQAVADAWTGEAYSEDFVHACHLLPHLPAAHAGTHLVKAAGKAIAQIEPADHGGAIDLVALRNALADAVICALAVANKLPAPVRFDLEEAVKARLTEIAERQAPADHATA